MHEKLVKLMLLPKVGNLQKKLLQNCENKH